MDQLDLKDVREMLEIKVLVEKKELKDAEETLERKDLLDT